MIDKNQILMASIATYGIGKEGGVEGVENVKCIGFINEVTPFEAGPKNRDACFVGETEEEIVVAFRGTKLPNQSGDKIDWLNNFRANAILAEGFPGKVHKGFYDALINLRNVGFVDNVIARLQKNKKPVVVTGYSKGGALAPLAAILLDNYGITATTIVLFEPPHAGDKDFAAAFNQKFPHAVRYEYQDDIVPHVPPSQEFINIISKNKWIGKAFALLFSDSAHWNYTPVAKLNYVNWDNTIVQDSLELQLKRMQHMTTAMAKDYKKLIRDHMPEGPNGEPQLFAVVASSESERCAICPTV